MTNADDGVAGVPVAGEQCCCTTAADLGFNGWDDGVNPSTIANRHPQCPAHGRCMYCLGRGAAHAPNCWVARRTHNERKDAP